MLRENPIVWFFFLVIALLDFTALVILFLAPSEPISIVVAPIIRAFWGERFLHYPGNFLLLPKLLNHAHFLISVFAGIFITGIVIKKIESFWDGTGKTAITVVKPVLKKLFQLLTVWIVAYVLFTYASKFLIQRLHVSIGPDLAIMYFLGLIYQSLFAFLIPAILINDKGFLKDVKAAFAFGLKNLWVTMQLLGIPMLLLIGMAFLRYMTPYYVSFYPELVFWILVFGIFVTLITDLLVTSLTTILFLEERKKS